MDLHRAIVGMLGSRAVALSVTAAGVAVLARLLEPAEFGVFAIAQGLFLLGIAVADFGLSSYLIRAAELRRDELASARGLAWVVAAGTAAAMVAGALLVAHLGAIDGLAACALVLAPGLLAMPIGLPADVVLRREMRFGPLAVLGVLRAVADTGVAIALALAGFGPVALAAGVAADRVLLAVGLAMLAPPAARVRPSAGGWRRFLGFGIDLAAIRLLPRLSDALTNAVIGGLLGMGALGFYGRARAVVTLVNHSAIQAVEPVVLPGLSGALRRGGQPEVLRLRMVACLAAFCWPALAVIALSAPVLVPTVLGPGWERAVQPVQILAATGVAMPVTMLSGKLFVALGESGLFRRIETMHHVLRLGLVAMGALHSLEGACVGFVLGTLLKAVLVHRAVGRLAPTPRRAMARALAEGALLTAASLVGPVLLIAVGPDLAGPPTLMLVLALAGAGWLAAAAAMDHVLMVEARAFLRSRSLRTPRAGADLRPER